MARIEPAAAATIVGIAGFQLLQAWNNNAPNLTDLRNAAQRHDGMRQQLLDADFMIGGIAIVLGVSFAVMTGDTTALLVMLIIFGSVSLWHHAVLNAPPV